MALSSIGDGGVHNGGGGGGGVGGWSFASLGFTTGLILPCLEILFVGLHILLRVSINCCACR